jgi:hypothetical protein
VIRTPALEAVCRADEGYGTVYLYLERPYECWVCPFATAVIDFAHDAPNPSDPGEGYYDCALLSLHAIWGESPQCTEDDWRARMRAELQSLRELAGLAETPRADRG